MDRGAVNWKWVAEALAARAKMEPSQLARFAAEVSEQRREQAKPTAKARAPRIHALPVDAPCTACGMMASSLPLLGAPEAVTCKECRQAIHPSLGLSDATLRAGEMHDKGSTYAEIGLALGVTGVRARQMVGTVHRRAMVAASVDPEPSIEKMRAAAKVELALAKARRSPAPGATWVEPTVERLELPTGRTELQELLARHPGMVFRCLACGVAVQTLEAKDAHVCQEIA